MTRHQSQRHLDLYCKGRIRIEEVLSLDFQWVVSIDTQRQPPQITETPLHMHKSIL